MSTPKIQNSEEKKRVNREQWLATAHEVIALLGLQVTQNEKPYKSFEDKEHFFIQQCVYPDGIQVMVKISEPNLTETVVLMKEAYWYIKMKALAQKAQKKGIVIPIHFLEVVEIFTYKEHAVMITQYVPNDWKAFKSLSQEEREKIIVTIIDGMLKLPVPEDEFALPLNKRHIPVILAEDYPKRARKYLGQLASSGHISKLDKKKILALMEKNIAIIDSFPMKLDHGDFHTGNFRYSKDVATGEDIITLFDLEFISIRNSFYMVAAAANFFDLAAFAHVHPERDGYPEILSDLSTFNTLFFVPKMIHKLERKFVMNNKRQRDAELVYRLMRIDDSYSRLAEAVEEADLLKEELNKVEADSYRRILHDQVALINESKNEK